jgi:large subunit ribosomal protein L20
MPRAKRGNKRTEKRKKILKLAKGYRGTKSKLYRSALESVERGLNFAYTGRKLKKRDFRSLWIVRIGAAARLNGLNYSQFMHGLKVAGIELDRKVLADLAANQPEAFTELAGQVRTALSNQPQQQQPAAAA